MRKKKFQHGFSKNSDNLLTSFWKYYFLFFFCSYLLCAQRNCNAINWLLPLRSAVKQQYLSHLFCESECGWVDPFHWYPCLIRLQPEGCADALSRRGEDHHWGDQEQRTNGGRGEVGRKRSTFFWCTTVGTVEPLLSVPVEGSESL